ncbi:MAG: hypothetical protein GOU98_03660 [Candidatus Altiarchaeota archaeon]|nr:hypothetical protein [Candidatus Altiarchaeota archaeon]
MRWEVSFDQFPVVSTFNDVRDFDVELEPELIMSVKNIVDKGKGKTFAGKIDWVRRSFGDRESGENFYILTVKRNKKVYSLLFKIEEGEHSKLLGTYPENMGKDELVDVLYEVLSEKVDEVSLLM